MALDTFTNLKTSIINYAFRTGDTEFTAAVPDFIALCEARLNRQLRVREQETVATITLTSGSGTLPSDYLEAVSVSTAGDCPRPLTAMPKTFGISEYPTASGGYADHYYITNSTITTVPANTTNLSMVYYAKVPALTDLAPTNWLLTKAPGVYLYGSLIEAAPYMMDDQRAATWGQFFDKEISELKSSDHMAKHSRPVQRHRGDTP